jgi:hypothetical protein
MGGLTDCQIKTKVDEHHNRVCPCHLHRTEHSTALDHRHVDRQIRSRHTFSFSESHESRSFNAPNKRRKPPSKDTPAL